MSKLTGGLTNYYLVPVLHPQRLEQEPYQAECEDISDALQLTPNEFCEFKAIWRTAAARLGNGKPDHKALYDAQKRVHYATRDLQKLQRELVDEAPATKPIEHQIQKVVEIGTVVDGGWIVHGGDVMPEPLSDEQLVDVRVTAQDGQTIEYTGNLAKMAVAWNWSSDADVARISHYRLTRMGDFSTVFPSWNTFVGKVMPEELTPESWVVIGYFNGQQENLQAKDVDWASPLLKYWAPNNSITEADADGWRLHIHGHRPYGVGPNTQVEVRLSNGHEVVASRKAAAWDWTYRQETPVRPPHISHWRFAK